MFQRKRRKNSVIEWFFRNRRTGEITIAQFPNLPLGMFLVATAFRWLVDPSGGLRTGVELVGAASLVWWAVDEVIRGVNPWRRLLGAAVLAAQVANYLR